MTNPIYLDYQATTPLDPRVLESMMPYLTEHFGNPSSKGHAYGWKAEAAVGVARKQLAKAIGASPKEIVFTSGATESNNLALKGYVLSLLEREKGPVHLITTRIEHKAVLDVAKCLSKQIEVTLLDVNSYGQVELPTLEKALKPHTKLVSVIFAHNELGSINPIRKIGELCKRREIVFHTDAVQAFGKIPINVEDLGIDLLSASSHKIYGPKGVGFLYVRKSPHPIHLSCMIQGGGQEDGVRSGTLNVPGIVGFGKAAETAVAEMAEETSKLQNLRDWLLRELQTLPGVILNGHPVERICNNLNPSIEGVDAQALQMMVKDLAFSTGSACESGNTEGSHVLKGIGCPERLLYSTIRLGIGRMTTPDQAHRAADRLKEAIKTLRDSQA